MTCIPIIAVCLHTPLSDGWKCKIGCKHRISNHKEFTECSRLERIYICIYVWEQSNRRRFNCKETRINDLDDSTYTLVLTRALQCLCLDYNKNIISVRCISRCLLESTILSNPGARPIGPDLIPALDQPLGCVSLMSLESLLNWYPELFFCTALQRLCCDWEQYAAYLLWLVENLERFGCKLEPRKYRFCEPGRIRYTNDSLFYHVWSSSPLHHFKTRHK